MNHRLLGALFLLFAALGLATPASADIATTATHGILMDYDTGQVLWAKDATTPMPPASMSKLMTIELLFQRLKDGRMKLTDTLPVSERAWRERSGSEMWVKIGDRMTVENLIRGVITVSANDGCMVLAEGMGGTVEGFVAMMNKRAKELGLAQSHFVNPDGLDQPPGQLMSALDLAKLARHLIHDYPQYYHFFSEHDMSWSNIHQDNRNPLLGAVPGADGLKTGHLEAAGYGLVGSAIRGGQRIILVLNGMQSIKDRADEGARIMEIGFREFRRYPLYKPGDTVATADVFGGAEKSVPLTVRAPVAITLQVDSRPGMKVAVRYNAPLKAPLAANQQVGTLNVTAPDFPGLSIPLYPAHAVERQGIFGRMWSGLMAMFGRK
ncbi:MAG TPA: D-alanyl-D-alanine carboxypeptidase family protein [Rhizomicrobium sp.]|jgi:D-alanyl-D-alanine carboxypeptidase (penicillin-binding protein 5/6)|nr:D-alanyl-D-alanine carboxypeptidase family protein [Rhizomicrobium sp.]